MLFQNREWSTWPDRLNARALSRDGDVVEVALVARLGEALESGVRPLHVAGVVLVVVELHDLARDVGLEGAVVVSKLGKRVGRHSEISRDCGGPSIGNVRRHDAASQGFSCLTIVASMSDRRGRRPIVVSARFHTRTIRSVPAVPSASQTSAGIEGPRSRRRACGEVEMRLDPRPAAAHPRDAIRATRRRRHARFSGPLEPEEHGGLVLCPAGLAVHFDDPPGLGIGIDDRLVPNADSRDRSISCPVSAALRPSAAVRTSRR